MATKEEEEFDEESWTHLTLEPKVEPPLEEEGETERKSYLPLDHQECLSLFDNDGRLIREAKLRKSLFEGMGILFIVHFIVYLFCLFLLLITHLLHYSVKVGGTENN